MASIYGMVFYYFSLKIFSFIVLEMELLCFTKSEEGCSCFRYL